MAWPPAMEASGDHWQAPFQAQLLSDPYGVVRYVAAEGLSRLPGFEGFEYDFLSPEAAQVAAKEQAMLHWEQNLRSPSTNPETTLQDPTAMVRKRILARFLSERDDRPITIKE